MTGDVEMNTVNPHTAKPLRASDTRFTLARYQILDSDSVY